MRIDRSLVCLLNVFSFGVWVIPFVFGAEQRKIVSFYGTVREYDAKDVATQIIRETISGPLKDYHVTLMMSSDLSWEMPLFEDLVSSIPVPIYIMRLGQKVTDKNHADFVNFNNSRDIQDEDFGEAESREMFNYNHMAPSVAVIVTSREGQEWWPLWNPNSSWSAKAVLIISTSSCWLPYLRSPFIDKTSFVAMICPYADKDRSGEPVSYKVITWLPFVLGQKLEYLGRWEVDSFPLWNKLFIDRFQDMSAKNLSTYAIDQDEPLVYIHEGKNLKGVNVNILDSLSKWLKFQNELDHGAGETWENVGELVRTGKRDVMINFNTNTPERYRDFDLSVAYHYEGFGLVLEVPPPFPRWQNILYPFSREVWISIIISLIVTIVFYHKLNIRNESSFVVNAISICQSLLSSPLATVPEPWRIRNFLLIWWIATWILKLSWICNLIAVLTIPIFPTKIQTKQELAESKYRLCMLDYGEFVPDALKTSEESTLSSLGQKLDLVPLMIEWSEFGHEGCVEKVVAGTHAQAETYSYINILYSRLKHSSRIYMLKEQLYPSYLSFRFRKHTPWKYKFDIGMQRLYESGLIQLWIQRAMEDFVDNTIQERSLSEQEALTLDHLQGTFFILAFGIFLAAFTLGGEVISPPKKLL